MIDIEKVVSGINYNGNPMELAGGITPTGNINITDTNVTDVTNYATATVVSENLTAENIKKNVNILGVVGIFEGGGGGGGDIVTPWYTVKTAEVTIGANSVNNPQTAVAYFEGIVGEGNVVSVFLKDQKATYGADELVSIPQVVLHTATNVVNAGASLYRMRNNTATAFSGTSGYVCHLYEGAKYAVIYYDTKP